MKWSVDRDDLNIPDRVEGISGFMRVRNEEEWLELSVESHIPFLDDIVIVYNRCEDSTPLLAMELEKKYPDKVRAISYEPDVYPQGSSEAKSLPIESENSLANYYNFSLCQTRCKIALKVDGDQIAIPFEYKNMCSFMRLKNRQNFYYKFRGINLYGRDKKVMVQGSRNFTGIDRGFFDINYETMPWHGMDRNRGVEMLGFKEINKKNSSVIGFFHTKGLKKDMGEGNYDLKDNPESRYKSIFDKEWRKSNPIAWEIFKNRNKRFLRNTPHPNSLGIYYGGE